MLHIDVPRLRGTIVGRRFELAAAAVTAAGKFVLTDWLELQLPYTVGAIAFWTIYVVLRRTDNPSVIQRWGFGRAGLAEGALLASGALVLLVAASVPFGVVSGNLMVNRNLFLLLAIYPVWGLIQQFLLVALLADNLVALAREKVPEFVIVMFSALVFSAVHFPDTALMIGTFFLGAATTLIFFRTRNIWAVGVLHGWFASLFYFLVMGFDPLEPLLGAAGL